MSNPIEIELELGALEFNAEDRTASGLLLPFGEVGRTSVGRLIVGAGAVQLPRDPSIVSANIEHDRHRNVARATELRETDAGIFAAFHIAETEDGDELLADIAAGRAPHLSVELAPGARVRQGGHVVSARLTGAAFVAEPAFESAAVFASANYTEDAIELEERERESLIREAVSANLHDERVALHTTSADSTAAVTSPSKKQSKKKKEVTTVSDNTTETPEAAVAVVPESVTASQPKPAPRKGSKAEVLGALARRANHNATAEDRKIVDSILTSSDEIFASLSVINYAGGPTPYENTPQYVGELKEVVYGQTAFADLVGQETLLRPQVQGFHFGTLPTSGTGASSWSSPYAGNAAAVPSSTITTTSTTVTAKYFAGGIEVPREWSAFGVDEALLGKYYERQAQNFGLFLDEGVFTTITAGLTAFDADNPSGITIGAGWSQLVDALFAVITQKGGTPDAAVIHPALWKSMAKVSNVDAFAYLTASLGLGEGGIEGLKLRPDTTGQLSSGQILAGNFKDGATLYTLPGSPLRFQALNISAGAAIDTSLFGAAAVMLEQPACFALVQPYGA